MNSDVNAGKVKPYSTMKIASSCTKAHIDYKKVHIQYQLWLNSIIKVSFDKKIALE